MGEKRKNRMNMIRVAYGDNVDIIIRILASRHAVEFREEPPAPEEAVNSTSMIITPRYTYLPAKLIKRLAWGVGISHKKIKKELARRGGIKYVALEDPIIGEIDRAYLVETMWVLPVIENSIEIPDWFHVEEIKMEPGTLGKAMVESVYKAAQELLEEMKSRH